MSFRVGLTGGIGSGKSTVAALFAELDVPVIDTDEISHRLTQAGGAAITRIQSDFGNDFIDGSGALSREKMRKLVFSDADAKYRLEKILHPLILSQAKLLADSSTAPYILLVIPLLFETTSDYTSWLNRTLTVDCREETQLSRATARAGMNETSVRAIMAQQLPRSRRLELSDDVIHNDGTLPELRDQVAILHRKYSSFAQTSN